MYMLSNSYTTYIQYATQLTCYYWLKTNFRIRVQVFTSMRIRIQGAKQIRIHADPEYGVDFAATFAVGF
jgi:hypothetical protein